MTVLFMDINVPNTSSDATEVLRTRATLAEKERDFIRSLFDYSSQMLEPIAKGVALTGMMVDIHAKIRASMKFAYCLFLECDKDCLEWQVKSMDDVSKKLANHQGDLTSIPQSLLTFAASPSCPIRHEDSLRDAKHWQIWREFYEENGFTSLSMVSTPSSDGKIQLTLVFQNAQNAINTSLMELALQTYAGWIQAALTRDKADRLLLEDSHRNAVTGFLNRYSFENSFELMLKDCRRHFQRVALLSVKILSTSKLDPDELRAFAEVVTETVRDNDLVAHFEERELVIGIRIQNMEDAEVVGTKLLKTLQKPEYKTNRLVQDGIALGVAFYPECSSVEELYKSALYAANSLKSSNGFRIEFHGELYATTSELYPNQS
ncbi:diguanylate cyclase domain-containing protein [Marinomonas sp.]